MKTENKTKEKTFRKVHFTSSMGCQICIEGDTCPFAKRGYICSLFDLRQITPKATHYMGSFFICLHTIYYFLLKPE